MGGASRSTLTSRRGTGQWSSDGTSVPPAARRMLMRISVMVVPNRADVTRVGFEEESRNRVDACRRRAADRTRRGSGRVGHRPLPLVRCPAFRAGVVVFRHGSRIGQDTRSALEPAVPVHHLFHGEGGDAAQDRLAERTAQDLVDPTALRLGLLSLLRFSLARHHRRTSHRRDRRRGCCRAGCIRAAAAAPCRRQADRPAARRACRPRQNRPDLVLAVSGVVAGTAPVGPCRRRTDRRRDHPACRPYRRQLGLRLRPSAARASPVRSMVTIPEPACRRCSISAKALRWSSGRLRTVSTAARCITSGGASART